MRTMTEPAIFTFAVSTTDLEAFAETAKKLGLETKGPVPGARDKSDGETLRWRSLVLGGHDFGNAIPFAIDWGTSTHPASTSPIGAELLSLTINHPQAEKLQSIYKTLAIPVQVDKGEAPEFIALLRTPSGDIELRGTIR
jgi:hypothetical protein